MPTTLRPAPAVEADILALKETLIDRILNVRRQHLRETGRKMSHEDAFNEVIRRAEASEPVDGDAELTREDLEPVACELASRGYSRETIEGALEDIGRTGTARDAIHIDDADRDAVEELIPTRVSA